MRVRTIGVTLVFFASILTVNLASAACTNASFVGPFGYFHGRPGGAGAVTKSLVGQMISDGLGNVSGKWTLSNNGAISAGVFSGIYSIAANCTGSLVLNNEIAPVANYNIVLDNAHHGFQMIETDSGTAQPGFGIARGTVVCALSGKKQTLATNFVGSLFPAPVMIEAIVGQIKLDGTGNLSGSETVSVGGTISAIQFTGTYTENPDCTGTAQVVSPAFPAPANFNVVVVNSGKELLLIETDNNTEVTGTAQQ
jgi:hypothetical protein